MQTDSTLQRLARTVLKQDPIEWVGHLRNAGMTWQEIADELGKRLEVSVSRETVRLWAVALESSEAAS